VRIQRVILKDHGNVEQVGRPLDLYDNPVNKFVAGFIGSPAMNFFPVSTQSGSDEVVFTDGQTLSLPAHNLLDGEFTIGLRPENLKQSANGVGLQTIIEESEQTGAETVLQATLADLPMTILLRDRIDVAPGDFLRIAIDPVQVQLFEIESGVRVSA